MGFDFGAAVGNLSGGPATFNSEPVAKVTNLRPHVDGGKSQPGHDPEGKQLLYDALILLGFFVVLLYCLGGGVFRSHNL